MKKNKTRKRRRPFDRIALFPHKPVPEGVAARQSLEKFFPCRFCQISYLDGMIEELTRLIDLKESRVAIVDATGINMSKFCSMMIMMQGNGRGFNS